MLKLYKRKGERVHYWEAWPVFWEPGRGRILMVHWGVVGEMGGVKKPRWKEGQSADDAIAAAARKARADGYVDLSIDEHHIVVVQYRTDGWGSVEDLEKRHKIEGIFNECLGWTGNGRCDGGDIGSGTINIFSLVVDPEQARDAMVADLKENGLLHGAVIAVRNKNEAEDYAVLWPRNFDGKFSVL